MSWRQSELLVAVFIVLFLATPFDVLKDPLVSRNPSASPLPVAFALGVLIGALLVRSPWFEDRFWRALRGSNWVTASTVLCVAVFLLPFVARDWASVIDYAEASRSLGFFGSNVYVYFMGIERDFGPWLTGAAGILSVAVFRCRRATSPHLDSALNESKLHIAVRCALMLVAGFFIRIASGCIFAGSLDVPTAALLNFLFHVVVFAVAEFAAWTLPEGIREHTRTTGAVWFALGIIGWGALIRVVPLSWILAGLVPALTLVSFSLIVLVTLLLAWRSRCASITEDNANSKSDSKGFSVEVLHLMFEKHGLAPREAQIALLYASGSTSGAIAPQLSIKPATVRSALQRSYRKLGVEDKEGFLALVEATAPVPTEEGADNAGEAEGFVRAFPHARIAMSAAAVILLVLLLVPACIPTEDWGAWRKLLYAVGMVLTLIGAAWAACLDRGEDVNFSVLAHMASFAALGFSWEESLRATGPYALPNVLGPLEVGIVLCAASALLDWKCISGRKASGVLVGFAAASITMAYILPVGLFALALVSSIGLLIGSIRTGEVSLSQVGACIATFGLAAIAADVLVNRFGDMIWGNDGWTKPYGGRAAFAVLCLVTIVVLAALVITLIFKVARRLRAARLASDAPTTLFELEGRARHLLLGRGLNDTQVSVLLLIAAGRSSTEICRELNYSRGAVNSARREGYARLHIHDRLGLLQLLAEVVNV